MFISNNYKYIRSNVKLLFLVFIILTSFSSLNYSFSENWKPNHFGSFLSTQIARSNLDIENSAFFSRIVYENERSSIALAIMAIESLTANGQIEDAIRIVNGIPDFSYITLGLYLKIIFLIDIGDYESVKETLSKINPNGIDSYILPVLQAWIEAGLRNHEQAVTALNIQANKGIFAPIYDYHSALISDWAGDYKLAEQKYEDAINRNNESNARLFIAASSFFNRHQINEKKLRIDKKFEKSMPDSSEFFIFKKNKDRINQIAPITNNIREGVAEAFLNASEILYNEGLISQALVYSQLALFLNNKLDNAKLIIGNIFKSNNNYSRAIQYYEDIDDFSLLKIKADIAIAKCFSEMQNINEAINLLNDDQNIYKNNFNYLKTIAEIYYDDKDFGSSNIYYTKVFESMSSLEKRHWPLLYAYGISLERAGKWEEAEDKFTQALIFSPDHPLILNYLGYSWLDRGVKIELALEMIKKAVEQQPNDGYIVDSLGWGYYQIGNYEDAVKYLENATELVPGDPIITDHLGDALFYAGRKIEAKFQWNKALEFEPTSELIIKIKNKIEGIQFPAPGIKATPSRDM